MKRINKFIDEFICCIIILYRNGNCNNNLINWWCKIVLSVLKGPLYELKIRNSNKKYEHIPHKFENVLF